MAGTEQTGPSELPAMPSSEQRQRPRAACGRQGIRDHWGLSVGQTVGASTLPTEAESLHMDGRTTMQNKSLGSGSPQSPQGQV